MNWVVERQHGMVLVWHGQFQSKTIIDTFKNFISVA
jgi:hypothetical protein